MKGILVGLLVARTLAAFVHEEYLPCEKTYIDPNVVDLHEKKIKVQEGEDIYQTSAIYSDREGLFYKDYLNRIEEQQVEEEVIDLAATDKQLDPLEDLPPPEQAPLYTDRLITKPQPTPAPAKEEKPLHKRGAWPYTNKRR